MKMDNAVFLEALRVEMQWRMDTSLGLRQGEDVPLMLPDGRRLMVKGCRSTVKKVVPGAPGEHNLSLHWDVVVAVDENGVEEPH